MVTVGELAIKTGASLEALLEALMQIVRADAAGSTYTILNPGCSEADLNAAEQRIGRSLHVLHRHLLRLSNGGSLPYVNAIDVFAAAVRRESEWRPLIALPNVEPKAPTFDTNAASGPFQPFVIGDSLKPSFGPYNYQALDLDSLIVIAFGAEGECFGYVQGEPDRIDIAVRGAGRGAAAVDFEQFIRAQLLFPQCETAEFMANVRALVI